MAPMADGPACGAAANAVVKKRASRDAYSKHVVGFEVEFDCQQTRPRKRPPRPVQLEKLLVRQSSREKTLEGLKSRVCSTDKLELRPSTSEGRLETVVGSSLGQPWKFDQPRPWTVSTIVGSSRSRELHLRHSMSTQSFFASRHLKDSVSSRIGSPPRLSHLRPIWAKPRGLQKSVHISSLRSALRKSSSGHSPVRRGSIARTPKFETVLEDQALTGSGESAHAFLRAKTGSSLSVGDLHSESAGDSYIMRLPTIRTPLHQSLAEDSVDSDGQDEILRTYHLEGGRLPGDFLARQTVETDGFADAETARMRHAFHCCLDSGGEEIAVESLPLAFQHLGYLGVDLGTLTALAGQVSDYASFNYKEFAEIVSKYAAIEQRLITQAFANSARSLYSSPSSAVSSSSLPRGRSFLLDVVSSLGVTTSRKALQNAFCAAGLAGEMERMDADMFNLLLAEYRSREGFSPAELHAAKRALNAITKTSNTTDAKVSTSEELPVSQLPNALREFIGRHAEQHIKSITSAFVARSGNADAGYWVVSFPDFVVWARRVREECLRELKRFFDSNCNMDDEVMVHELALHMHELGFTLLESAVQEFLRLAGCKKDALDFDEFVRFVHECRQGQGFSSFEIQELAEVFASFDYDKSGQIEVLELLDMMRYFGHNMTVDAAFRIIKKADVNVSGSLDFAEMLTFMCMSRDQSYDAVLDAFNNFKGIDQTLNPNRLAEALILLDPSWTIPVVERASDCNGVENYTLSFDRFATVVDQCQRLAAATTRRYAGFMQPEVELVKKYFDAGVGRRLNRGKRGQTPALQPADGGQTDAARAPLEESEPFIEQGELTLLLMDFAVPMNTSAERRTIYRVVPLAREDALKSGVPPESVGSCGPNEQVGTVTLWTVLHLLRRLVRDAEREAVFEELTAMEATCFSQMEVTEFREIFLVCSATSSVHGAEGEEPDTTKDDERKTSRRASVHQALQVPEPMSLADALGSVRDEGGGILKEKGFGGDSRPVYLVGANFLRNSSRGQRLRLYDVRQLLGCLGMRLRLDQQADLATRFKELVTVRSEASRAKAKNRQEEFLSQGAEVGLDFPGFLHLMRWMLDANFANINGTAEQVLNRAKKKKMELPRTPTMSNVVGEPKLMRSPTRRFTGH